MTEMIFDPQHDANLGFGNGTVLSMLRGEHDAQLRSSLDRSLIQVLSPGDGLRTLSLGELE
jgi:hypothetical protein